MTSTSAKSSKISIFQQKEQITFRTHTTHTHNTHTHTKHTQHTHRHTQHNTTQHKTHTTHYPIRLFRIQQTTKGHQKGALKLTHFERVCQPLFELLTWGIIQLRNRRLGLY